MWVRDTVRNKSLVVRCAGKSYFSVVADVLVVVCANVSQQQVLRWTDVVDRV